MTGDDRHIAVGEVTSLDDKKNLGRVRVKFPHLAGVESAWCPVVAPMGGAGRGFVFLPEVGDHVLVVSLCGDLNQAFVIGAIRSERQKPPEGDGKPTENNLRLIRSRSGHQITLDDTRGKERIVVVDKDGGRKVVIDSGQKKVQVLCDNGDVEVEAKAGNVSVKGGKEVSVQAATVTIKADKEMTLQAGATLTIKGATVNIN
jgi:phage baseplate assembly protein V